MVKVYGIPNCDTVKKARKWLDAQGVDYEFIDFKKSPPTEALLKTWLKHWPWDELINKRGTTWRKLSDDIKDAMNPSLAISTMMEQPSIIKRPVLIDGKQHLLGFKEADYQAFFS